MFDEMEALATVYGIQPSEAKAMSIRERYNWVNRAYERTLRRKEAVESNG